MLTGDERKVSDGSSPTEVAARDTKAKVVVAGHRKQRMHHKRHLSRSSSAADYAPGNALINELGNPDNMFVTENGTVVTSQIGGTAILPCATAKLGTATVSTHTNIYANHIIQRIGIVLSFIMIIFLFVRTTGTYYQTGGEKAQ